MFELVLAKMHEWNGLWKSICSRHSVLQKNYDFGYEDGLRMKESCFRSVRECERCLQSLLWLVFTGMRDWSCFAILLVFEVRKCKLGYRLVPSP